MATLDLAGIITRVCTDLKEKFASKSVETSKQDKLVSGANIKTINGTSLLGSGNVSFADSVGCFLRTDNTSMTASDSSASLRIWLTSADGTKMVPINTSTSTSPTAAKTLNTRPIDPFGRIMYYTSYGYANSSLFVNSQWDQYPITIGYSYVKKLTNKLPVYLKCTPQSDGSAVMADVVQEWPATKDGYIYIFLGVATSTTTMELQMHHPVYYHDGTGICLWTGVAANEASVAVETLYDSSTITIKRSGRTIMVQAHGVSATPSTSTAVLANVLADYKPAYNMSTTVLTSSGGSTQAARMVVYASDGGVYIVPAGYSSSASWYGTLTYIY